MNTIEKNNTVTQIAVLNGYAFGLAAITESIISLIRIFGMGFYYILKGFILPLYVLIDILNNLDL